ncbi:MAG: hypothetical protein EXS13_08300 [Planctomycetes bacterium]|nr:hypothetical protein [Planctomycetota bacterium]
MARPSSPFLRGGNLKDSLGTTLNGLLQMVPPDELKALKAQVRAEGLARGVVYEDDDGRPQPTPILLRPRVLGGNQRNYLHQICRVMEGAWIKLYALWRDDAAARKYLPMTPREEKWLADLGGKQADVLYGRWDATSDFGSKNWLKSTQFFEYNPIGAGGTYLAPAVDEIILTTVVPALRKHAPTLLLEMNDDPRIVLLEVLADHARSLKLRRFNIALCQYKGLKGGVEEFPFNVAFFRAMGVNCWHVDPRELRVEDGELSCTEAGVDHPIDLVYRDHEVNDLAAQEEAGVDMSGMKHALKAGRCISSLVGEFDHKSAFHVFTEERFAAAFSSEERKVFRAHVPWTRLIEERRTAGPDGESIDLLPWMTTNRESLLLKPNRSYGGTGILLGPDVSERAWTQALERGVKNPGTWVVQGYRPVAEKDFPVIDEDGNVGLAEYFTVLGLYASEQRLGVLGRGSRRRVVNVAQKGGLVSVLRLL